MPFPTKSSCCFCVGAPHPQPSLLDPPMHLQNYSQMYAYVCMSVSHLQHVILTYLIDWLVVCLCV